MSVLYSGAKAITKSDSTIQDIDGFYVGGAGDVTVTTAAGQLVTFTAPPVGTVINVRCKKVMAATSATLIIGLLK